MPRGFCVAKRSTGKTKRRYKFVCWFLLGLGHWDLEFLLYIDKNLEIVYYFSQDTEI